MMVTKYFLTKDSITTHSYNTFQEAIDAILEHCSTEAYLEIVNWDAIKQKVNEKNYHACTFQIGYVDEHFLEIDRLTCYEKIANHIEKFNFNDIDHKGYIIANKWIDVKYDRVNDEVNFIYDGVNYACFMNGVENPIDVFKEKATKCDNELRRKLAFYPFQYKPTSSTSMMYKNEIVLQDKFENTVEISIDGFIKYRKHGGLGYTTYTKLEEFIWSNVY